MTPKDYRILWMFLGGLVILCGVFVVCQTTAHPTVRATDTEALDQTLAAPRTDRTSQLTYAKDHEAEWATAISGDRTKALPAWEKILARFRLNVVGSGAAAATEGLKASEAWQGKITGDSNLDSRIIEAAVMTNLYSEGKIWDLISKDLDEAASNDKIEQTLTENKY